MTAARVDGRFCFEAVPTGMYELELQSADVNVSGSPVPVSVSQAITTEVGDVPALSLVRVTGKVEYGEEEECRWRMVRFGRRVGESTVYTWSDVERTGEFSVHLVPGHYSPELTNWGSDYEVKAQDVDVAPGEPRASSSCRGRDREPPSGEKPSCDADVGKALMIVGYLLFASVFATAACSSGDFTNFEERGRSSMLRAFGGMGLMVLGGVLRFIGFAGAAGSGMVLDPERARRDIEPWARMTGGLVKDGLDEAGIDLGGKRNEPSDFDDRLRKLHRLHEVGILTKEEYEREKRQVLDEGD